MTPKVTLENWEFPLIQKLNAGFVAATKANASDEDVAKHVGSVMEVIETVKQLLRAAVEYTLTNTPDHYSSMIKDIVKDDLLKRLNLDDVEVGK